MGLTQVVLTRGEKRCFRDRTECVGWPMRCAAEPEAGCKDCSHGWGKVTWPWRHTYRRKNRSVEDVYFSTSTLWYHWGSCGEWPLLAPVLSVCPSLLAPLDSTPSHCPLCVMAWRGPNSFACPCPAQSIRLENVGDVSTWIPSLLMSWAPE